MAEAIYLIIYRKDEIAALPLVARNDRKQHYDTASQGHGKAVSYSSSILLQRKNVKQGKKQMRLTAQFFRIPIVLAFFLTVLAVVIHPTTSTATAVWKTYTTADGLANNNVLAVNQQ